MAKKRVIYALLYSNGGFMLSRNFRLQRAGDVNWLLKNYNFSAISAHIDELLIIDVTRGGSDRSKYLATVQRVIENCFIPVALGGGIRDFESAAAMISSGADKLVLNTAFDTHPEVVQRIVDVYGSQCVVGGLDLRRSADGSFGVVSEQGTTSLDVTPAQRIHRMLELGAGEILLQSMDRDGTGFGMDVDMLTSIGAPLDAPLILFGGCGKGVHMLEALQRVEVDAVATANLFNFIGDGLQKARRELLKHELDLAQWVGADIESLRGSVK